MNSKQVAIMNLYRVGQPYFYYTPEFYKTISRLCLFTLFYSLKLLRRNPNILKIIILRFLSVPKRSAMVPLRHFFVPVRRVRVPVRLILVPLQNILIPVRHFLVPLCRVIAPLQFVRVPLRRDLVPQRFIMVPVPDLMESILRAATCLIDPAKPIRHQLVQTRI